MKLVHMVAIRQEWYHVNLLLTENQRRSSVSINNNKHSEDKSVSHENCTDIENICYATDCSKIATLNIVLIAGQRQIPIRVCDDCKSKFE